MTPASRDRIDVVAVRHDNPIEAVVSASGVVLTQRGRGFMGCCPFHDDPTPSLSVGGIPERFHCFGCGVSGDVIEYVARLNGLSFVDAVQTLESGSLRHEAQPAVTRHAQLPACATLLTTTAKRAHTINHLAWEFFTTPANIGDAETYLREARGMDVGALCAANGGEPIVGHARTDWRALTRHLLSHGVTDHELLELDLAHRSRYGELIDTYRGRLIVPLLGDGLHIDGFIGRDVTGDPRGTEVPQPDPDTDVRQVDRALPANPSRPGP